jgi:hypothetical protein
MAMLDVNQPQPAKTVSQRRRELESLKKTPEGLQKLTAIFREMVLLPGESMPPRISLDSMISGILDAEFVKT